jgi:cell wall-associated NlpC family hydrolase
MAGGNLPVTLLVLGGGIAMVWTGITDPKDGLVGEISRVLKGEKDPNALKSKASSSGSDIASAILASSVGNGGAGQGGAAQAGFASSNGIVAAAQKELGVKYVWGGGNTKGPTGGGFDCSGLTQYAYYQGAGITIPRTSETQQLSATRLSESQAVPGDLVFFGAPAYHVGIVLGGGQMIHAPHTGTVVKVEAISDVTPGPTTYGRFGNSGGKVASI